MSYFLASALRLPFRGFIVLPSRLFSSLRYCTSLDAFFFVAAPWIFFCLRGVVAFLSCPHFQI
jgi:hypothetical protein